MNSGVPFWELPDEIFLYFASEHADDASVWMLGQVCRRFRNLIKGCKGGRLAAVLEPQRWPFPETWDKREFAVYERTRGCPRWLLKAIENDLEGLVSWGLPVGDENTILECFVRYFTGLFPYAVFCGSVSSARRILLLRGTTFRILCEDEEDIMFCAIRSQSTEMIDYVMESFIERNIARSHAGFVYNDAMQLAASTGNRRLVEHIYYHHHGLACDRDPPTWMFRAGSIEVYEFATGLVENFAGTPDLCRIAAASGDVEFLKWARLEKGVGWGKCCNVAAALGKTDILDWALSNGAPKGVQIAFLAAVNGHPETLECAIKHGCPLSTPFFSGEEIPLDLLAEFLESEFGTKSPRGTGLEAFIHSKRMECIKYLRSLPNNTPAFNQN